jgi:hypothetical protein
MHRKPLPENFRHPGLPTAAARRSRAKARPAETTRGKRARRGPAPIVARSFAGRISSRSAAVQECTIVDPDDPVLPPAIPQAAYAAAELRQSPMNRYESIRSPRR